MQIASQGPACRVVEAGSRWTESGGGEWRPGPLSLLFVLAVERIESRDYYQ